METLGSLTDKLGVVNLKLWHQEEKAQAAGADDHTVAEAKRKISGLNLQRNALMQEIDELFQAVVEGHKKVPIAPQFKDYTR